LKFVACHNVRVITEYPSTYSSTELTLRQGRHQLLLSVQSNTKVTQCMRSQHMDISTIDIWFEKILYNPKRLEYDLVMAELSPQQSKPHPNTSSSKGEDSTAYQRCPIKRQDSHVYHNSNHAQDSNCKRGTKLMWKKKYRSIVRM
jgi:hypothetical protein